MESTEPDAAQDTVIADDAMDICTTPPPNEHEDLSAFYQTSGNLILHHHFPQFYSINILIELQIAIQRIP